MTRKLELKESQSSYLTALDAVVGSGETVILEQDGQPVAVLLPIEVYRALQDRPAPFGSLSDPDRQGLELDRAAYLRLRDELLKTYRGQYVGFKDGKFVDSDPDGSALMQRMYDRFGYVPIYVKKVEEQERVYHVPGPRRVR